MREGAEKRLAQIITVVVAVAFLYGVCYVVEVCYFIYNLMNFLEIDHSVVVLLLQIQTIFEALILVQLLRLLLFYYFLLDLVNGRLFDSDARTFDWQVSFMRIEDAVSDLLASKRGLQTLYLQ